MDRVTCSEILGVLPVAAAVLDGAGVIVAANAAFARRMVRAPEALAGKSLFRELDHVEGLASGEEAFRSRMEAGEGEVTFASRMPRNGGVGEEPVETRVRIRCGRLGDERFALVLLEEATPGAHADDLRGELDATYAVVRHVRHEINNPLMGILGLVELLLTRERLGEDERKKLQLIASEAGRIRDRVLELKTLGPKQ